VSPPERVESLVRHRDFFESTTMHFDESSVDVGTRLSVLFATRKGRAALSSYPYL